MGTKIENDMSLAERLSAMRPQLLRFAKQRMHDLALAEDVVQESLLAVLEAPERFAGKSSLSTYIIGIIKYKIIDNFRKEKHTQMVSDDHNFDTTYQQEATYQFTNNRYGITRSSLCEEFDPVNALEQKNFFFQLEKALCDLPPKSAKIFSLADCLEVDSSDICAELGISKNNLMVSLHRTRHALRQIPTLQNCWQTLASQ
jgi:RNA polymerase sigma-70 factor (ECF subfamily)